MANEIKYVGEEAIQRVITNVKGLLDDKQDTLTFDNAPTENSTNPVKSGGVYTALGGKVDKVTGKGLSTNDYTTAEKNKLSGIESGAEVNTIESVKSGTTTFTPDSNKVVDIQNVDNLSNYYKKSETYTKTEVDGKVSSVYKPSGSVTFANLPTLSASVLGNVYNVTDAFTTTSNFVEGAGKSYPAGTNVVVVDIGSATYKFDVLAGFVDLSGYQPTIADLSTIRSNASAGKSASDTIATYGDVVTHNTSEFQPKIDSSHKVSADLIDDSSATNKFVTASDKSTWNAKQNAITSSNKLSSDLVDDTNHTNKFVTTTEKNTWNGKQDAMTALTSAEIDAMF